ncbi:MAG: ABC transporter permease, partial [Candidatus Izimaplasma sp.]|nr:ABC transporter permease [Candidatus Izimaplasma bacterium]
HEAKYAEEYASRTVKLLDGEVIEDSDEFTGTEEETGYVANKTAMSFWTALKLSFNNLKTKKFRTTITALASSIGIIGVGLVLSISNGFSGILDSLESDQLVGLPIMITEGQEFFMGPGRMIADEDDGLGGEGEEIVVYDADDYNHINLITPDFVDYLNSMDDSVYTTMQYNYGYRPQLLVEENGVSKTINNQDLNFSSYITPDDELDEYYELLTGAFPQNPYEVTLLVKDGNIVDIDVIETLGLDPEDDIIFDDILGLHIYVARNDDYYAESNNLFIPQFAHLDTVLDNGVELTITGIVQMIDETISIGGDNGIYYLYSLEEELINLNMASDICVAQAATNVSVFNGEVLGDEEKLNTLSYLGCNNSLPKMINIYSNSIENKTAIKDYIDEYNTGLEEVNQIEELDLAETIGDTMGTIISMVSIVLSSFASISLVVSSVMIGIIIYISVLERTKEIGIIRSLGGRKKDISRVFNAESIIIGAFAGVLGVIITFLLTFPINILVERFEESLVGVARVNILHLLALVLVSTVLTFIGGFIPSRMAAKKDPVEALRVE